MEPEHTKGKILLQWIEKGSDHVLKPHQASDGTLRFIVLATLLLFPPSIPPRLIILDEPELGLHPKALSALRSLFNLSRQYSQIIVATQSSEFLDYFTADDVIVVDRSQFAPDENEPQSLPSTFMKRKNAEELSEWLNDYTLSELWNKNVLGGRP